MAQNTGTSILVWIPVTPRVRGPSIATHACVSNFRSSSPTRKCRQKIIARWCTSLRQGTTSIIIHLSELSLPILDGKRNEETPSPAFSSGASKIGVAVFLPRNVCTAFSGELHVECLPGFGGIDVHSSFGSGDHRNLRSSVFLPRNVWTAFSGELHVECLPGFGGIDVHSSFGSGDCTV